MAKVLVFDVIETLLDLGSLRERSRGPSVTPPRCASGSPGLLHGSLVATVTGAYEDFASIGRWALEAVAVMTLGILEIGGLFNVVCGMVIAWGRLPLGVRGGGEADGPKKKLSSRN